MRKAFILLLSCMLMCVPLHAYWQSALVGTATAVGPSNFPSSNHLAFVQAQGAFVNNTSLTQTISITTTAGNLIIVCSRNIANNANGLTPTDSASQTYVNRQDGTTGAGGNSCWDVPNSAALTSVTCNWTANPGTHACNVYEVKGAATSGELDTAASSGTAGTVTTSTSGTFTTTNAKDIIIFDTSVSANQSPPFYTAESSPLSMTLPTNGGNDRLGMTYVIVSSIQTAITVNMTYAVAAQNKNIVMCFKSS